MKDWRKNTVRTWSKRLDGPGTDAMADQAQRWVANCGRHTPDLAVLSFHEGYFQPCRGNGLADADRWLATPQSSWLVYKTHLGRAGDKIAQIDSATKPGQHLLLRAAFDLGPIGLGLLSLGIADSMLQGSVVSQHEESFAIPVQPARRVYIRNADVILQGRPGRVQSELADDPIRLVEEHQLRRTAWALWLWSGGRHPRRVRATLGHRLAVFVRGDVVVRRQREELDEVFAQCQSLEHFCSLHVLARGILVFAEESPNFVQFLRQ